MFFYFLHNRYERNDLDDIYCHLTNTARASEDVTFIEEKFVQLLDDLPKHLCLYHKRKVRNMIEAKEIVDAIREKINLITRFNINFFLLILFSHSFIFDAKIFSDLFNAFENEYTIFSPMSNCFEVFGLDFMVDEDFNVSLLEVHIYYSISYVCMVHTIVFLYYMNYMSRLIPALISSKQEENYNE